MTETNSTDASTTEPNESWTAEESTALADRLQAAEDDSQGAAVDARETQTASRREATYRVRAREAEAFASALTERVTRMQRAEVERQAAVRLHDPADLWVSGVELVELLDEDGEVDQQRVTEAVAALADSKPYMVKPSRRSSTGFGQGRRTPVDNGSGTDWGQVLRGRP
jgi:hypothetical protein